MAFKDPSPMLKIQWSLRLFSWSLKAAESIGETNLQRGQETLSALGAAPPQRIRPKCWQHPSASILPGQAGNELCRFDVSWCNF